MKFEIRKSDNLKSGDESYRYEVYLDGKRLDKGVADIELKMAPTKRPRVIVTLVPDVIEASLDALLDITYPY